MLNSMLLADAKSSRISRSVVIRRPPSALYTAWYHLSQRPALATTASGSQVKGGAPQRIKAPCGYSALSTCIADHIHGLFIAWKSVLASGIEQTGEVWFHTGSSGAETTVNVLLSWDHSEPAASASAPAADVDIAQLDQDLMAFKSLMEG